MMSAAVTISIARARLALGNRFLGEAGECIVFAQNSNDRFAFTELRGESRRDLGDTSFDAKACRFQPVSKELRRLRFLVTRFGPVPDLRGVFPGLVAVRTRGLHDGGF